VISCDVLCHAGVTDKRAALRELTRVLKPGGLLMLNLPAYPWLLSSHDLAVHNDRRFTRGEVLGLLREQALTPLRATYWNSLLFLPIAMIRCWRKFRPAKHSDLDDETSPWINNCLSALLAMEGALIRLMPLPLGLSIFFVGRRAMGKRPRSGSTTPPVF
jgi:SAM-dependent methyltransferase